MSSSSRKAERYLRSLEVASREGRLIEIQELSRKVRKHDPTRTCFARSAEVQARLLLKWSREERAIDEANFNAINGEFYWLQGDVQELEIERSLLREAYDAHDTASVHDKAFYDLTNLFYGITIRQLSAAEALAIQIVSHPEISQSCQFLSLVGIMEELQGRSSRAIVHYERCSSASASTSHSQDDVWISYALYRLAVLIPEQATKDKYMAREHKPDHRNSFSVRLLHVVSLHAQSAEYAKELLRQTHFPNADATNLRLLNQVSLTMDPWIASGGNPKDAEELLNMLFDAARKTFHSPRILRYLIQVLAALDRYVEAILALKAYLQVAIHATRTQNSGDIDTNEQILRTIHFAISRILSEVPASFKPAQHMQELCVSLKKLQSDLHITDLPLQGTIDGVNGVAASLTYRVSRDPLDLHKAIDALESSKQKAPNIADIVDLAVVYVQHDQLPAAMTSIRQALQLGNSNIQSMIVFANLLCCEELYDRALVVLERVMNLDIPKPISLRDRTFLVHAKTMELKIIEITDGPAKALESSSQLIIMYATHFHRRTDRTLPTSDAPRRTAAPSARANGEYTTPTPTSTSTPTPTIQVNSPSQEIFQTSPSVVNPDHLGPGSAGRKTRSLTSTNGRSSSNPVRSSSVRLAHPHLHIAQHFYLRKSASSRSMRRPQTPQDGSSRSSSPLNHPAPSINTIFPEAVEREDQIESDRQATAQEVEEKKRDLLLADTWLYIAHLCRASKAPLADALQAIEEARLLVGQTPSIIALQLEIRLELATAQGLPDRAELNLIEEGFDFAQNLDDMDEAANLSFVQFLLRDEAVRPGEDGSQAGDSRQNVRDAGRLARAYELLECLKSGPAAADPRVWQLSGDVAVRRGEEERAEEEYWNAIKASDCRGVIDWYKIR